MQRSRRIGSVTLGITMVLFGTAFLVQMFIPTIEIHMILKVWPVILIMLGLEILIENNKAEEVKYIYDFPAIFMIIVMGGFTMCMAGLEYLMRTGYINP